MEANKAGTQVAPAVRPAYAALLVERRQVLHDELSRILTPGARFLWEVGCGHGHFLAAYAAAHPERLCIGVDLASERIERALRKRDRARLANLHFIRADAHLFLKSIPAGAEISDLFILFPDPWPKSRHHKHRVLQPAFLAAAALVAAPDCHLYFRTDFRPYFDDAGTTIRDSTHWELLDAAPPWPFEFATVFQARARHHDSLIARRRPTRPQLGASKTRLG